MSTSHHSAGQPGADRCSESATGSDKRRAKSRPTLARESLPFPHARRLFDNRGRQVGVEWFDVRRESYRDGHRTGYAVFGDFMRWVRSGEANHIQMRAVVDRTFSLLFDDEEVGSAIGRRGAAVGFITLLMSALRFGSIHMDFESFVASQVAEFDAQRQADREDEAERRADFVRRMREAKARKACAARGAQQ